MIYVVECKGEPKHNLRYRYPILVSALGEIIQRVTRQKYAKYAIALPATYKEFVTRKIPWVASKRLPLEILLVNPDGRCRCKGCGAINDIPWALKRTCDKEVKHI